MIQSLRKDQGGFTLVEIMIVVAIIGLLAAIAVPSFIRARQRSQATTILNEARMVDAAKDQYALETNKSAGMTPQWADLTPYLKAGSALAASNNKDKLGHAFDIGDINGRVRVHNDTITALSASAGDTATFWGPYS